MLYKRSINICKDVPRDIRINLTTSYLRLDYKALQSKSIPHTVKCTNHLSLVAAISYRNLRDLNINGRRDALFAALNVKAVYDSPSKHPVFSILYFSHNNGTSFISKIRLILELKSIFI